MDISGTKKINQPFINLLWLLLTPALLIAGGPKEPKKEPPPFSERLELVQIIPSCENVRLDSSFHPGDGAHPWGSSGTITISVRSHLPEWGAVVQGVNIQGPAGTLPLDRVWVRTEETGGEYAPLTRPVPVIRGDFRQPVKETRMVIAVRPTWQDPPGEYHGTLTFAPTGPGQILPGSKAPPRMTSAQKGGYYKQLPHVDFSLRIQEIIEIVITGGQLDFTGGGPEGTYFADQEVRFRVLTNSRQWRVVCHASNLKSERGEIPAERIQWQRVNERGRVLDEGNLGLETTVLQGGYGISAEEEIILKFSLDISMADIAGNYKGNISLMGITGN